MPRIRAAHDADLEAMHRLNEAEVPRVSSLAADAFRSLVRSADLSIVATEEDSEEALGFLLAMAPGHSYRSPNYRWFERRHPNAVFYVDRLAVVAEARQRGVGRLLYETAHIEARARGLEAIGCEVNILPPNPESSEFHRRVGFSAVGTRSHGGPDQQVELLLRRLTP